MPFASTAAPCSLRWHFFSTLRTVATFFILVFFFYLRKDICKIRIYQFQLIIQEGAGGATVLFLLVPLAAALKTVFGSFR
jgi:hypothetical protein